MAYIDVYKEVLSIKEEKLLFNYLIKSMKETIKGWDFFVDWAKVKSNVKNVEVSLNILNYLIGKENIEQEFRKLISQYPETINVIPILIATRDKELTVLDSSEDNGFNFKKYNFSNKNLNDEFYNDVTLFVNKVGLLDLFKNKQVKNLVDYVMGVEVGLDSNARKNRSGTSMELITELFVKRVCDKYGYRFITQATSEKIKQEFGYNVKVDKNQRRFDFAIDTNSNLFLLETNYYSGGGSKLKATAGEYKSLYDFIKQGNDKHHFIWITDGKGWETAKNPLEETFNYIDYILNIEMLEKGILDLILSR